MSDRVVARITIERSLDDQGLDLVHVDSDDLVGGRIPIVEALGLLQLAIWDVCESPVDDDEDEGDDEP